jgi:hypothetical protein
MMVGLLVGPASVYGQSAADLLRTLADAQADRVEGVDNITVVSTVGGSMAMFDQMTTYYTRTEDGSSFTARTRMEGGMADMMQGDMPSPMQNDPFLINTMLADYFADSAVYEGSESIDGQPVEVVYIEDMTPLARALAEEQGETFDESTQVTDVRIYIDTDSQVIRRIESKMTSDFGQGMPGGQSEIRTADMTFNLADFQDVDGVRYPFTMRMELSGVMSEDEIAQMRQQMEQMQAQLDQMPPAQREQIEELMGGMEGMLSGTISFESTATEVRVNEGPPQGM